MNPDPLESFVQKAVRDLPSRKAPRSLESRVLAEIARREALPWWQRSWTYWPAPVRWAFLILTAAVAAAVLYGAVTLLRGASSDLAAQASAPLDRALGLWGALKSLGRVSADLTRLIPAPWLYSILGGFALVYAMLFGIGATAYRTLWQSR
jgi:hypothetical protein